MEQYDHNETKKQLTCLMSGCKACRARGYCNAHDKPDHANAPSIPQHCKECGDWIYNEKEKKGMFS